MVGGAVVPVREDAVVFCVGGGRWAGPNSSVYHLIVLDGAVRWVVARRVGVSWATSTRFRACVNCPRRSGDGGSKGQAECQNHGCGSSEF